MKKRILAMLLCAAVLAGLVACGKTGENVTPAVPEPAVTDTVEPTPPAFDCEAVYGHVLAKFYALIAHPEKEEEFEYGVRGAYEAANALGDAALDTIGYVFRDINGDGKEELLIGCFEPAEFAYVQNELYAAYTYNGQAPELLFEGRSRNAYSLTEDDTFFYYGSNGAIYSIFGEYALTEDGKLQCLDFYFTYEKDETWENIGVYHNTSDQWDPKVSEELDITTEGFWNMQDALAGKTVKLDSAKFAALAFEEALLPNQANESKTTGFDEALAILQEESPEAQSMLLGGFEAIDNDCIENVNGEWCRRVDLYRDDTANSGQVYYNCFAVSPSGAVYLSENADEPVWHAVNSVASVFAGKAENDLFFVTTDPQSEEYETFSKKAVSVSTPLVGNNDPSPILLVALQDNLLLTVAMQDGDFSETYYNGMVCAGQTLAIGAELQESGSPLTVTAVWNDGAGEHTAVWHANYSGGQRAYSLYAGAK